MDQQGTDVVNIHLAPVVASAGQSAIYIQFVLIVAGNMDLRDLGDIYLKRFAEVAVADRHFVLGVGGRPNPIRADELQEFGAFLGREFFDCSWRGWRRLGGWLWLRRCPASVLIILLSLIRGVALLHRSLSGLWPLLPL